MNAAGYIENNSSVVSSCSKRLAIFWCFFRGFCKTLYLIFYLERTVGYVHKKHDEGLSQVGIRCSPTTFMALKHHFILLLYWWEENVAGSRVILHQQVLASWMQSGVCLIVVTIVKICHPELAVVLSGCYFQAENLFSCCCPPRVLSCPAHLHIKLEWFTVVSVLWTVWKLCCLWRFGVRNRVATISQLID